MATETLTNTTDSGVEHAVVSPSALVQGASILVPVGPIDENTTALTLANPSMGFGAVNLILTDQLGRVVLDRIVQLAPRGHFSQYLNTFFGRQPDGFSTPLLLTLSSDIPVAVLALNFREASFASIPLTSLTTPTPVPVQALTPATSITSSAPTPVVFVPSAGTTSAASQVLIGGNNSMVFAQIAAGGGWSTELAIGNTSPGTQKIRIDFFGPDGSNTGSLTNIDIPPRGVFFFSTDSRTVVAR